MIFTYNHSIAIHYDSIVVVIVTHGNSWTIWNHTWGYLCRYNRSKNVTRLLRYCKFEKNTDCKFTEDLIKLYFRRQIWQPAYKKVAKLHSCILYEYSFPTADANYNFPVNDALKLSLSRNLLQFYFCKLPVYSFTSSLCGVNHAIIPFGSERGNEHCFR